MIHNRTSLAARALIKFELGRSTQILSRVHVLEADGNFPRPVLATALHHPIITTITVSVSRAITGHFLLSTERALGQVRVQVAFGIHVRQTDRCPTDHGCRNLWTGGRRPVFGFIFVVVRRPDPPQGVVRGGVLNKGDNILPRTTAQLFFFR